MGAKDSPSFRVGYLTANRYSEMALALPLSASHVSFVSIVNEVLFINRNGWMISRGRNLAVYAVTARLFLLFYWTLSELDHLLHLELACEGLMHLEILAEHFMHPSVRLPGSIE